MEENKIENDIPNSNNPTLKKKNRTLQFYKFLFYSIKLEIKFHEFLDLVRYTNQSEILLWILSLILYINTPKDFPKIVNDNEKVVKYKNTFIWFHIFHLIRGIIGIYLWNKLPKSYQLVEALKGTPDEKLSKTLFNDLVRETANIQIIKPYAEKKLAFYIYIGCTFFNFIIDVIDFLVVLAGLKNATSDAKVVLLTYLLIGFLYCVCDLSYFFWAGMLKLHFPPQYLSPIEDAFNGTVKKLYKRFKISKPKTDIKEEAKAQNQGNENTNGNNNEVKLPELNERITGDNNQENINPVQISGNNSGVDHNEVSIVI